LFQATKIMFSQILGLYADEDHLLDSHLSSAMAGTPLLDVTFESVRNRLWRLQEEKSMFAIQEFIHGERVLIADGHHRYETSLQFRDASRSRNPSQTGKEAYNFVPMYLTNLHDPGLVVLPTHRLLHDVPNFRPSTFLGQLEEYFTVSPPLAPER